LPFSASVKALNKLQTLRDWNVSGWRATSSFYRWFMKSWRHENLKKRVRRSSLDGRTTGTFHG
jgi:hypothetical protein